MTLETAFLPGSAAFLLSVALTPLVAVLARRIGAVAKPKNDRWHKRLTAMLGGVAIFVAAMLPLLALVPQSRQGWGVLAGAAALFLLGLGDDFLQFAPYQKLIGQLLGAAAAVSFGLVLPWTPFQLVNVSITVFWIVGITNAVNMLDNMDGLAAGVSAIAAAFLALHFQAGHHGPEAMMLTALAGALLGFLIYNHHPASIFMGDCGSMFIGFFLACGAVLSATAGGVAAGGRAALLAVPMLVLVVPIFDASFVSVMRTAAGRAVSQGGRDHTSHRLVALGLSEKHAVWMLYAFAAGGGALALLVRRARPAVSVAAIAVFALLLTLLAVLLARVRVYDEPVPALK